jgi:GTP cyclohydrolase II
MRLDDLNPACDSERLTLKASATLPTPYGEYLVHVFADVHTQVEHIALVLGNIAGQSGVLTRVHSECLTGDIFSSQRCDCGEQLQLAQSLIFQTGQGLIIYLRGQEGRGIGITNKILAYGLQDKGLDTVEANLELNLPVDSRSYEAAAEILKKLEVVSITLLTNNPDKVSSLITYKILIDEIRSLETNINASNKSYLHTKKLKLGHRLSLNFVTSL